MPVDSIAPVATTAAVPTPRGKGLGADDFMQLLVTQLTNQDPLEPTSNEDLLNQLASIRDIELSTNLSNSLTTLVGSQRYGASASLIGQYVTGHVGDDPSNTKAVSGTVVGVRYSESGQVLLDLDNGAQVPLERTDSVASPVHAARSLIGRTVRAAEPADPADPLQGVVTSVRTELSGRVMLELDTGDSLAFEEAVLVE